MPFLLIPILIIVGVFAVSAGDELIKDLDLPTPSFRLFPERSEGQPGTPSPAPRPSSIQQAPPAPSPPPFLLDTTITAGPEPGATLPRKTSVTFEFSGSVSPETEGRISFETKLEGFDDDWKATSSTTRKINLPPGSEHYTFLVRSKLKDAIDQTPASRTFFLNVSPYFGTVQIAGLSEARGDSPSLITITGRLSAQETMNLTGWTLKGRAGSYAIPYASKTVDAGLSLNPIEEVTLKRSGKVLISSARGPFGLQSNFQPNKCMGHLRPSMSFPIPVPSSCSVEKPTEAQVLYFSLPCQDYILEKINYRSCTPPELTEANEVTLDSQCTRYLDELFEEFTYQGCLELHQEDEDFFKNEWHLYRNADLLTQRADAIELYDAQGLFVDRREY